MEKKPDIKKIIYVAVAVIVVCCIILGVKSCNKNKGNTKAKELATVSVEPSTVDGDKVQNPVNFAELRKDNQDIYGWIKVADTQVDYPIMKYDGDDQSFYLTHEPDGTPSIYGSIYFERKNNPEFTDRVTIIYGHCMNNGSMFGDLHKFEDPDFFKEHEFIEICIPGHILKYQVVSALQYDDRHILNSFDFSNDQVFKDFIDSMLNPATFVQNVREGAEFTIDDKMVILSTCVNTDENARYLVVLKAVEDQETY